MTDNVCQLNEEEQMGKIREGRKTEPNSKMPELGWDIAETQLQSGYEPTGYQESTQTNSQQTPHPLQAIIAIAVIIATILEHIRMHIQEIPEILRKTTQAVKLVIIKSSRTKLLENIRKSYRTALLAISIATRMTNRTNHTGQQQIMNNNKKILQAHKNSATNMTDCTSRVHPWPTANSTTTKTSCKTVSNVLRKDRINHGNTQTENSK